LSRPWSLTCSPLSLSRNSLALSPSPAMSFLLASVAPGARLG
jgi:hypothetical protein